MDKTKAKTYLNNVTKSKEFGKCMANLCEYLAGVYDLWQKDNPLKRLKTKTKGRTEIVNCVREFQRGKLKFIPMLTGISHGFSTASSKYQENLGGKGADQDIGDAIRTVARLYKEEVWNRLCQWATTNTSTIWDDPAICKSMKEYLEDASKNSKVSWLEVLFSSSLKFWSPREDKKYGIKTNTTAANLNDEYDQWESDLLKNLKKDNNNVTQIKNLKTSKKLQKDMGEFKENLKKTKLESIEEKKPSTDNQIVEDNEYDFSSSDKWINDVDEEVLEETSDICSFPAFLLRRPMSFGFENNVNQIETSILSTVHSANSLLKGELDKRLKKAGFWN